MTGKNYVQGTLPFEFGNFLHGIASVMELSDVLPFPDILEGLDLGKVMMADLQDFLEVEQVIFNPPATVVFWKDGTKTVVRCYNDEFSEEFGFAMACMRKIYGSRNEFKAQYENAYRPYLAKNKKTKATSTKD